MSSNRRAPRRIGLGIGAGLAGLTALGLAFANLNTASAANISLGKIGVYTDGLPSGTASLKIEFEGADSTCFAGDFTPDVAMTRSTAFTDQAFSITPHSDTNCQGEATSPGISYKFPDGDPNVKTGCESIYVSIDRAYHAFVNC